MASNFNDIYKMTSNPLGYCVIINMVNFDGNTEIDRVDSIENVNLIRKTFEYLNFKVKPFQDLNDNQIKLKLNELISSEECDSHDCFVLYIHSHGLENGFITKNNVIIGFNEIIKIFCNQNCEKFINKPKIILFDCCRGGMSLEFVTI